MMKKPIDVDALLSPIPGDNPAGEDLRYSPVYDEISEARREDDTLDRGQWQRDLKKADWDRVAEACGTIVGETAPYFLMRFGFTRDGVTTCITDPTAQEWCNGHHNWDEKLTATATLDEYYVEMKLNVIQSEWNDTLVIRDPGSVTPREGPFDLVDTGCRTIPPGNLNACQWRMRID